MGLDEKIRQWQGATCKRTRDILFAEIALELDQQIAVSVIRYRRLIPSFAPDDLRQICLMTLLEMLPLYKLDGTIKKRFTNACYYSLIDALRHEVGKGSGEQQKRERYALKQASGEADEEIGQRQVVVCEPPDDAQYADLCEGLRSIVDPSDRPFFDMLVQGWKPSDIREATGLSARAVDTIIWRVRMHLRDSPLARQMACVDEYRWFPISKEGERE